jgi:hypothetical protein
MTNVYITIDTEYSSSLFRKLGPASRAENFDKSIRGKSPDGDAGISYQMDVFDRHGIKAVFFVDPMPALIWGVEAISDIVGPIVTRGHDVQLHLHSEWLEFAGQNNPVGNRTGKNIKDFHLEDQTILLDYARSALIAAGAPAPIAFRAGNYGANDDTLRALSALGITYDSSHCPGIANGDCAISLGPDDRAPMQHCGVIEVPAASIAARGTAQRHGQITALSAAEALAAVRHAQAHAVPGLHLVSHSFELMSRDRKRANRVVKRRFERLCAGLSALQGVATATYVTAPPRIQNGHYSAPILPHSWLRTLPRLGEQAISNFFAGDK